MSKDISRFRRRQRPIRKVGGMTATHNQNSSMINHKDRIHKNRRSHHNPDASRVELRTFETRRVPVTLLSNRREAAPYLASLGVRQACTMKDLSKGQRENHDENTGNDTAAPFDRA